MFVLLTGKGDAKSGGDNNVRPMELMRGALRVVSVIICMPYIEEQNDVLIQLSYCSV